MLCRSAVMFGCALWATLALTACGGHARARPTAPRAPITAAPVTTATTEGTTPLARPPRRRRPRRPRRSLVALALADGRRPQTRQRPSAANPRFGAEMRALFAAVRGDTVATGMGAFFPETAYAQLKAIADPAADFSQRLVASFALDLAAAHVLLGADAQRARLIAVRVPGADAHWVAPGACLNRLGYYEVANARVVYRTGGTVRSFGIASLISWRGVWYVVHLGAVVRPATAGGVVDAPSAGPGVSVPSATC